MARKAAEQLLEEKSRELYSTNTELRTYTDRLQRQSQQTQGILDTAAEGIICFDDAGTITRFNLAAARIFDLPAEDAIDRRIQDVFPELPIDTMNQLSGEVAERGVAEFEVQRQNAHAERSIPLHLSLSQSVIGEHRLHTAIVRDLTKRKQLESQLAHASKMESVGQLAAGIAHEINTPIQYVSDNLRFLTDAFADLQALLQQFEQIEANVQEVPQVANLIRDLESLRETRDIEFALSEIPLAIEQALDGSQRVAKIIQAMREFSHPGGRVKQAVDLNRAIGSTTVVARNEWKYVASLELDLDDAVTNVPCYPDALNQVILNLIINASHAIEAVQNQDPRNLGSPRKGVICIRTRSCGDEVEIQVADSGCGIPAKNQTRVFDPFFTTKAVGKGTGQGLAIAYSVIVDQHHGSISLESKEGIGTTFTIRLPLLGSQDPSLVD